MKSAAPIILWAKHVRGDVYVGRLKRPGEHERGFDKYILCSYAQRKIDEARAAPAKGAQAQGATGGQKSFSVYVEPEQSPEEIKLIEEELAERLRRSGGDCE